jgi:hypothetical protein
MELEVDVLILKKKDKAIPLQALRVPGR